MLIRTFPLWFIKLLSVQLHTGVANDTALSSLLQFIKRINNSSTLTSQTFGFTLFRITRSATQACSDIDSRFHHWRMCGVKDFSVHCIHTVVDNFMAYHRIYSYQSQCRVIVHLLLLNNVKLNPNHSKIYLFKKISLQMPSAFCQPFCS